VNSDAGVVYVKHYWVDGRQKTCRVPSPEASARPEADDAADPSTNDSGKVAMSHDLDKRLKAVEERLTQVLQASEEDRASRHRAVLTGFFLVALASMLVIAYVIQQWVWPPQVPDPKVIQRIPAVIKIGDRTVRIGIGVLDWDVPDQVKAEVAEYARLRLELEEKMRQAAEEARQKAAEEQAAQDAQSEGTSK
jgi:hypothetical protein